MIFSPIMKVLFQHTKKEDFYNHYFIGISTYNVEKAFLLRIIYLRSSVFKYKSGGWNATYYDKTKHHFKVQTYENLGISHIIYKKVKIGKNTQHWSKNSSYFETTLDTLKTFLDSRKNGNNLIWMESLLIVHDKLMLNKLGTSIPIFIIYFGSYHMFYHTIWYPSTPCGYNIIVCLAFIVMLQNLMVLLKKK